MCPRDLDIEETDYGRGRPGRLVRTVKRKPKKIQYWPHLSDGCLAGTGLITNRGNHEHYEFNLVRCASGIPGTHA